MHECPAPVVSFRLVAIGAVVVVIESGSALPSEHGWYPKE